jgi:sulfoxide reductase heme-binding subunit YedZ
MAFATGSLGARPLNEAIHQYGLWMLRFLFIALAITPLRWILQWQRLVLVRRMTGVAAFCYGIMHLLLYTGDQGWDLAKVASEIVLRIYLTIGFIALFGLAVLAATSTDGMVRRLGQRWRQLHWLVYPIAMLAVIHFSMQSKLEQWEPTLMAGFLFWLFGYRLLAARFAVRGVLPVAWVATLGVAAAALTALGEAAYFQLALGADPTRVLQADLSLDLGVRPAVVVLAVGVLVTIAAALRSWVIPAKPRPRFA